MSAGTSSARWPSRLSTAIVFGLWALLVVHAIDFVVAYASPIPLWDDLALVRWVPGELPIDLVNLWDQHNEHRIPLAKLIAILLVRGAEDFRAPMLLSVLMLATTALVALLAVRRRRGSTRLSDAIFPLVWLHTGHGANLIMGFQIALVLPMMLVTLAALLLAREGPLGSRRIALVGAIALTLPLNGGAGAMHAIVWCVVLGLLGARELRRARRGPGVTALAFALVTAALVAVYLVGLEQREQLASGLPRADDLGSQVATALRFLSLSVGPAGAELAWGGAAALAGALGTLVVLARGAFAEDGRPSTWAPGIALVGGVLTTAAAIGWSRGGAELGGYAQRYVVLAAPLATGLALAWDTNRSAHTARVGRGLLALALLVALVPNHRAGSWIGVYRRELHQTLTSDVERGFSTAQLAREHWRDCSARSSFFAEQLATLRAHRWPPYERAEGPDTPLAGARPRFPMFVTAPDRIEPDGSHYKRRIHQRSALLTAGGTRLVYALTPQHRLLRGGYGVPPGAWETGTVETVTVTVSIEANGERTPLLVRELVPGTTPEDRGIQPFEIELPRGLPRGAELVLSTDEQPSGVVWSFWCDLELE